MKRFTLLTFVMVLGFAVIFTGLWLTRGTDLKRNAIWIYPVTAILSILMAWFDGTIRKWFLKIELDKVGGKTKSALIIKYKKDLNDLPQHVHEGILTQAEADREEKDLKKKIRRLIR